MPRSVIGKSLGFGALNPRRLGNRANSAIEFAIMLPVFMLLLGTIVNFGDMVLRHEAVEASAHLGGLYATQPDVTDTDIREVVESSSWLPNETLNISVTTYCQCGTGARLSCPATCPAGESERSYTEISVQTPFDPLFPFPDFLRPGPIGAVAVVRHQ